MASGILDAVLFNPTAGGTTNWTYSSAVTGYQSPAAAGAVDTTVYFYRAYSSDLTQWEEGFGAWTASGGVLARTTVLFNSAGNTSKISFTNPPFVAIVAPTSFLRDAGALFNTGVVPIARLATGTPTGSKFIRDDNTLQTIITPKAADQQIFTTSSTWTKQSGFSSKAYALIQVWGAGGGGCRDSSANNLQGAGGGSYNERWVLLSSLGATETVTVAAGGLGRTTSTGNGGNGGNTTFGSWLTAYGGNGCQSGGTPANNGASFLAAGGNTNGTTAMNQAQTPFNGGSGAGFGSNAGASSMGGGGGGCTAGGATATGGNSFAGSPGATAVAGVPTKPGFSGGGASSTSANTNGGDGGDGKCVVTVFDGA